jgi:Flp pilus assembly protein TadB
VHAQHLRHTGNTEQAKERLTMMGGSGIAIGFVALLAMGVFVLVLVGLVVWLVARPRDRS